jgi:hypothetical protein
MMGGGLPTGNSELVLASVYKSPGLAWIDITELLSLRRKSILAGDLNIKNSFWNSAISSSSGDKLLHLFDANQLEISTPQCPNHYSPAGYGDVLYIVVHQKYPSISCYSF